MTYSTDNRLRTGFWRFWCRIYSLPNETSSSVVFIKELAHFEGLIIDDLGYVQQSREEMEVLFILLAERYERGSVFISSNLIVMLWRGPLVMARLAHLGSF